MRPPRRAPVSSTASPPRRAPALAALALAACAASGCAADVVPNVGPSCAGLAASCGADGDEGCCARREVPGGTFNRSNDVKFAATVSPFALDRFHVTVGRFRRFVDAYPASRPGDGAGAHPALAGSGWQPLWDDELSTDRVRLTQALRCSDNATWTDAPGDHEERPIVCVTWYEAFAFCAWDGGRLPTDTEWNFAATGGSAQSLYPWGNDALTAERAVYDCLGDGSAAKACAPGDVQKVGARSPQGDGRWGHADLVGLTWEWMLDNQSFDYLSPCTDCADVKDSNFRLKRGGSWRSPADDLRVVLESRLNLIEDFRGDDVGFRCVNALPE